MSKEEVKKVLSQFRFEDIDMSSRKATYWLKDNLSLISPLRRDKMLKVVESPTSVKLGRMYFFSYNPKYKVTLPFYDQFPLVFMLERQKAGFLGLNLHYLRLSNRASFINYLIDFADSPIWYTDPKARLLLEYSNIKSNKYLKSCVKSYCYSNFLTGVIEVRPADWKIVPFLPLDKFQKATREEVWKWAGK